MDQAWRVRAEELRQKQASGGETHGRGIARGTLTLTTPGDTSRSAEPFLCLHPTRAIQRRLYIDLLRY
jgi:hypothetical protein